MTPATAAGRALLESATYSEGPGKDTLGPAIVAIELEAARVVGGRKVGPMGWPWDVEMPTYARLQVKKLATPPSLRFIAAELARIARHPGEEMPGFIWLEPGRDGERLVVFRLKDFAERHGIPSVDEEEAA